MTAKNSVAVDAASNDGKGLGFPGDDWFDQKSVDQMFTELDLPEAEGWRPEPGAKIVGVLISRSEVTGGKYADYPILELRELGSGSIVNVHCFHTQLKSLVERRNPSEGDLVGIAYNGFKETPGKTQDGYESYNLRVRHA